MTQKHDSPVVYPHTVSSNATKPVRNPFGVWSRKLKCCSKLLVKICKLTKNKHQTNTSSNASKKPAANITGCRIYFKLIPWDDRENEMTTNYMLKKRNTYEVAHKLASLWIWIKCQMINFFFYSNMKNYLCDDGGFQASLFLLRCS